MRASPAEVIELTPGRGSCVARLPATGPDTEPPLILLSHLDVVPVDAESWSRDPFGGDLVDGVVWGRGAVDMKDMVAMELAVLLALKRSGAELRRDVIFAAVADEEAGGEHGARGLVQQRPELFHDDAGRAAAVALNEVGGYSMTLGGRRFYTIQVAEKGIAWTRLRNDRDARPWLHAARRQCRRQARVRGDGPGGRPVATDGTGDPGRRGLPRRPRSRRGRSAGRGRPIGRGGPAEVPGRRSGHAQIAGRDAARHRHARPS